MSANAMVLGVSLALGAAAWIIFLWAIRRAERHFTHHTENK